MKTPIQILLPTNPTDGSRLLVACLILEFSVFFQSAQSQPALVGEWLDGATNFADVSGFAPSGTHDGYIVGAGHCVFTNDLPPLPFISGQSLLFYNGDTGLAISNSSTVDANYRDTFDHRINHAMTVTFFARGWPGQWNPFVSKYGEDGAGWQFRSNGQNNQDPCWTIRGTGGDVTLGTDIFGNPEDLSSQGLNLGNDSNWHYYVGTFDAATGVRNLYVDGVLVGTETNNTLYSLAPDEHLCLGAKDSGGGNLGFFSTFEIFDVRIFNFAPTSDASPLAWRIVPGPDGGKLILTWPWGALLQATNLAGSWLPAGTSPYTNSMTGTQMFFKVSLNFIHPL